MNNSNKRYTQGPWKVENHTEHQGPYTSAALEVWSNNRHIGTIHEHVDDICIDKANARLIAAAPELLEALEYVRTMLNETHPENRDLIKTLDAALAKARGES